MSTVNLYNPFETLVGTMLTDIVRNPTYSRKTVYSPPANIYSNEESYVIEMAVPGYSREDLNVKIEGDALYVSSKMESKSKTNDMKKAYTEFDYSKFERVWTVPESCDKENVSAEYEAGILRISIPLLVRKNGKKIIDIK